MRGLHSSAVKSPRQFEERVATVAQRQENQQAEEAGNEDVEVQIDFSDLSLTSSLMSQFLIAEEILETKTTWPVSSSSGSRAAPPPSPSAANQPPHHPSVSASSSATSEVHSHLSGNHRHLVASPTTERHQESLPASMTDHANQNDQPQLEPSPYHNNSLSDPQQRHQSSQSQQSHNQLQSQSPSQLLHNQLQSQSQLLLNITLRQLEQATQEKAALWQQLQRAQTQLDETRHELVRAQGEVRELRKQKQQQHLSVYPDHEPSICRPTSLASFSLQEDKTPWTLVTSADSNTRSLSGNNNKNPVEGRMEATLQEMQDLLSEMRHQQEQQQQPSLAPPSPPISQMHVLARRGNSTTGHVELNNNARLLSAFGEALYGLVVRTIPARLSVEWNRWVRLFVDEQPSSKRSNYNNNKATTTTGQNRYQSDKDNIDCVRWERLGQGRYCKKQ